MRYGRSKKRREERAIRSAIGACGNGRGNPQRAAAPTRDGDSRSVNPTALRRRRFTTPPDARRFANAVRYSSTRGDVSEQFFPQVHSSAERRTRNLDGSSGAKPGEPAKLPSDAEVDELMIP
jgi:hypothetical protein